VFVVIEHGARRLLHLNVTAHPTAAWTLQKLREALGYEDRYRYLIRDRDSIVAKSLDESIERLGLEGLTSPLRSPKANAICERAIGTIRRECLDWLIPMSEAHLRSILKDWRAHHSRAPPHMARGPERARPAPENCRIPNSAISTSYSRGLPHARETGAGRAASRAFIAAGCRLIRFRGGYPDRTWRVT